MNIKTFLMNFFIGCLTFAIGIGWLGIHQFFVPFPNATEFAEVKTVPNISLRKSNGWEAETETVVTKPNSFHKRDVAIEKEGINAKFDIIDENLVKLYSEYEAMSANSSLSTLVALDTKIRKFISDLPSDRKKSGSADSKYWKEKYSKMGLFIGKYGDQFGYSGKLLSKAHKINPHSRFREYTLYSEVIEITWTGLEQMPNIKSAYQYSKEFPKGPFISDVLGIIADFHKDLFMVIRNYSIKNNDKDYKFDCFKSYIEKMPYSEQLQRNKNIAINYHLRALRTGNSNSRSKQHWAKGFY